MKNPMRQCELRRVCTNSIIKRVVWLDTTNLVYGSRISLAGSDEIWTVSSISDKALPKEYVDDRSRDYLRTRKFSDV